MGEHDCIQEKELGELAAKVDRVEKELFNGSGLAKAIPVLSTQVENLRESISDLRIAVSGLNKFMNETKGGRSTVKNMVPWIAVLVAFLGLIFTVTQTSKIKNDQYRMENTLQYKQDRPPDPTTRGGVKANVNKNESSIKP
jgi:hypothetical protein